MIIRRKEFNKRVLSRIEQGYKVVIPREGITTEDVKFLHLFNIDVEFDAKTVLLSSRRASTSIAKEREEFANPMV